MAGPWVHQAGGDLSTERVVDTRLVAADAGVDPVCTTGPRLGDEGRVSKERPSHRDQIADPFGQEPLGDLGRIDSVAGHHGDADILLQPSRDLRESRTGDRGGDRGNPGFVPADSRVDHGRPGGLELLGKLQVLLQGGSTLDQVEQGQPEAQDEVVAHALTRAPQRLDGKPLPPTGVASPLVGAHVRARREERVDQVALRAHDLHAVIPAARASSAAVTKSSIVCSTSAF